MLIPQDKTLNLKRGYEAQNINRFRKKRWPAYRAIFCKYEINIGPDENSSQGNPNLCSLEAGNE